MTLYTEYKIAIGRMLPDGKYPVSFIRADQGETELGEGLLNRTAVLPWALAAFSEQDGENLFNALFADDEMKRGWAKSLGEAPAGRRIRLQIERQAPELYSIPWELLREPARTDSLTGNAIGLAHDLAASATTPFSRFSNIGAPYQEPLRQDSIRVLVAVADPQNLHEYGSVDLNVAEEKSNLQTAFRDASGIRVEVTFLPEPCTLSALENELRNGYHILHLLAHGALIAGTGETALLLADRYNCVDVVRDTEFAAMLARHISQTVMNSPHSLRLVFLANCYSGHQDVRDTFLGLAPKLVAEGTPAVVAMQQGICISTARVFAATFYRNLFNHGVVDLAVNEARSSLITARQAGVAIPVLHMRLRAGQLFQRQAQLSPEPGKSHVGNNNIDIVELGKLLRSEAFTYQDLTDTLAPNLGYRAGQLAGISVGQLRFANALLEQARADDKLDQLVAEIQRMKPHLPSTLWQK